jgi:BlaI family penicillinase repressor
LIGGNTLEKISKISESEWEVMKIIWEHGPVTSDKIIALLADEVNWTQQTIKTFINRLLKKGVLGYKKEGRWYHYYPLISKEECIKEESEFFLERVFNGAVGTLVSNFLEEAHLSENEIEKLQMILQEKKKKDGNNLK